MTSLYGSRFLSRKKGGGWEELSVVSARDKVSHALRHAHRAASRASQPPTAAAAEGRLRPRSVSAETEASARAAAGTPSPSPPPSPSSSLAVLPPHRRNATAPPLESPLVFNRPPPPADQAPNDFEQEGTPPRNPALTDRMHRHHSTDELLPLLSLPSSWFWTAVEDPDGNDMDALLDDMARGD